MANMTSQNDESRREAEGARDGDANPSTMARVTAGASTLTSQQLRKARASVDEQISSQRERVTGRVRTLSRALRGAGEMLEGDDLVAQCLHYVSDKAEGVAGYVEELEPTRAAEDLRTLARDRPAWFFGGAFALGLALGRFARSSAEAMSSSGSTGGERPVSQRRAVNTTTGASASPTSTPAMPPRSAGSTGMAGAPGGMAGSTGGMAGTTGSASARPQAGSTPPATPGGSQQTTGGSPTRTGALRP